MSIQKFVPCIDGNCNNYTKYDSPNTLEFLRKRSAYTYSWTEMVCQMVPRSSRYNLPGPPIHQVFWRSVYVKIRGINETQIFCRGERFCMIFFFTRYHSN